MANPTSANCGCSTKEQPSPRSLGPGSSCKSPPAPLDTPRFSPALKPLTLSREKHPVHLRCTISRMTSGVLRNRLRSAFRVAELGVGAALASARSRLVNIRGEVQPPPRQPYVQNVSVSSAVIAWVSEEPDAGLVEYGETPQLGRKGVDAQVDRRHA